MIIVILGASGGVGRGLVRQGLAAGHEVRVVLRPTSASPTDDQRVSVTRLDVNARSSDLSAGRNPSPDVTPQMRLAGTLAGADVVLSALGARTPADHGVLASAARVVVAATAISRVGRYIGLSAAPVATVAVPGRPRPPRYDPGDDPLARYLLMPLVKRFFAAGYSDTAEMEAVIRSSALRWTLIRPPRLTDRPATGRYRVAVDRNVWGGRRVSRADVAALMLKSITDQATSGHTLGIAD